MAVPAGVRFEISRRARRTDFANGRSLFKFAATLAFETRQSLNRRGPHCLPPACGQGSPAWTPRHGTHWAVARPRAARCTTCCAQMCWPDAAATPFQSVPVKAPPAHSSRPKAHRARVPRFPARPSAAPGAAPPRGRRPASSILAAARSEDARARAAPPPPPGRVLGAAETARLALLMENGGALPAHAAHGPLGGCRPRARRRGMQEEALALLEQVPPLPRARTPRHLISVHGAQADRLGQLHWKHAQTRPGRPRCSGGSWQRLRTSRAAPRCIYSVQACVPLSCLTKSASALGAARRISDAVARRATRFASVASASRSWRGRRAVARRPARPAVPPRLRLRQRGTTWRAAWRSCAGQPPYWRAARPRAHCWRAARHWERWWRDARRRTWVPRAALRPRSARARLPCERALPRTDTACAFKEWAGLGAG